MVEYVQLLITNCKCIVLLFVDLFVCRCSFSVFWLGKAFHDDTTLTFMFQTLTGHRSGSRGITWVLTSRAFSQRFYWNWHLASGAKILLGLHLTHVEKKRALYTSLKSHSKKVFQIQSLMTVRVRSRCPQQSFSCWEIFPVSPHLYILYVQ